MDSIRFFGEVIRRSAPQGISAGEIKDGFLTMAFHANGSPLCRVTGDGDVHYRDKDINTPEKEKALRYIISVCQSASEYVQAIEYAPALKAVDLDEKYKLLLEYNGVVLAGTDMGPSNGYQFVTWCYTYDKSGVTLGHYFLNKYQEAKEEFVARSGLVPEYRMFNEDQLLDIYRAAAFSLSENTGLTWKQEDDLKEVMKQIERIDPDIEARWKYEQSELKRISKITMGGMQMKTVYALVKYHGNSLAVDFPLDINDLPDHLGSIGVALSASKVTVSGTEDVAVKFTGLNEVGNAIVNKLSGSDSLVDINMLCHAVQEACPYGYDDMADRLADSSAESAKELMQVVEEFRTGQQAHKMGGI